MKPQDLWLVLDKYIKLSRAATCPSGEARTVNDRIQRYKENLIRDFFRFWSEREQSWPIKTAVVLDWVSQGCAPAHPYRDRHRFFAVRDFLKHLRALESSTEIPVNVFRKPPRRIPRLFSQQEITNLIKAPSRLRLVHPFRSLMLSTLIGLLASTGLRIGEALRLLDTDVRLEADPAHLVINNSKFGKSRIVVLHASAVPHLLNDGAQRALLPSISSAKAFFTNPAGRPLGYIATYRTFRRLLRHAQIASNPPERAANVALFSAHVRRRAANGLAS
jgi:integrase/recombinase XerD